MNQHIESVILQFDIPDGAWTAEPYGNGHINDTYLIAAGEKHFILQRVNGYVFPKPEDVIENIERVTDFLKEQIAQEGGDPERETLTLVKTQQGTHFAYDEQGNLWRMYLFIEDAVSRDLPDTPELFELCGEAFGKFQRQMGAFPADSLHETIHDFHNTLFLGFVIMSQMFSPVVLLVGISQLMNTLHLNDTILGLMLINAAFNQAFAIWLLRGTFVSISPEMEQAACIDGCNTVGALWHILLPMAAPGIVTTLIFVFINSWNEYTISTVLISTPANKPITVGITQFSSFNMIEWQYLFAAALLATIPVIILFMCIEKHLAEGLTSGGVKG